MENPTQRPSQPTEFWHATSPAHRDSISESGLLPSKAEEAGGHGIWLWSSRDLAQTEGHDIWHVKPDQQQIEHGSEASAEWNDDDLVWVTYEALPPSTLTREPGR